MRVDAPEAAEAAVVVTRIGSVIYGKADTYDGAVHGDKKRI